MEIAQRETELSTERNSRLPDLNASLGTNIYFGRGPSRDGTYVDNTQLSGSLGVSASVPVFQGMRINRRIKGAKLDLAAATADCERMREDLAVRIMTSTSKYSSRRSSRPSPNTSSTSARARSSAAACSWRRAAIPFRPATKARRSVRPTSWPSPKPATPSRSRCST